MPATNSLLRALSRKDAERLLARHKQVDLTYGEILCEPGKPLRHVYFPNSGIISLLTPVDGHDSAEVGLVGKEGMAGMGLFLGVGISPVRMLVQGTGTAMRIPAFVGMTTKGTQRLVQSFLGVAEARRRYAMECGARKTSICQLLYYLSKRADTQLSMPQCVY